jgi:hypothetical protein
LLDLDISQLRHGRPSYTTEFFDARFMLPALGALTQNEALA